MEVEIMSIVGVDALAQVRMVLMPSQLSDVEAPVTILILNGSPCACRRSAFAAMAWVTTLGAPGAVKPEKPQLQSS